MGRYKGKRESTPLKKESADLPALGDPFAEDSPYQESVASRIAGFFHSRRGKILLTVLGCVAVLAVAGGVALSLWIRPPDLPSQTTNSTDTSDDTVKINDRADVTETEDPSEDELYPDDGYGGDMPELSGDRKEGVFTFLLVGTDEGDGNTDTLMVVTYDTKNQDINIMSIPRDTMINASWDIKKINSVYSRYKDGIDALQKRIKTLIGFRPDFYVKIELDMFVELVDLIGGVAFNVPQDMDYDDPYQDLHIHLKKGEQVLDGNDAMGLVRFRRYAEGDIKRVEVQQSFMKALIQECLALKNWGKIKSYIDLAMENMETDLEFGSVVWFAANVIGLNGVPALNVDTDVRTFTIPGDYYATAWSRTTQSMQSYVTIYPRQVVEMVNEYFNPYEQDVTTSMLDAMSINSNGEIVSSTGSLQDTKHNASLSLYYADSSDSDSDTTDPNTDASSGESDGESDGNAETTGTSSQPQKDRYGNYYIIDEDGHVVYTDAKGNILEEPSLPEMENNNENNNENSDNSNSSTEPNGDTGHSTDDPSEGDTPSSSSSEDEDGEEAGEEEGNPDTETGSDPADSAEPSLPNDGPSTTDTDTTPADTTPADTNFAEPTDTGNPENTEDTPAAEPEGNDPVTTEPTPSVENTTTDVPTEPEEPVPDESSTEAPGWLFS